MPRLIDADALIQAAEVALTAAQKTGDTREIIKYNMLLCALRDAETVDPVHAADGCYCRECKSGRKPRDGGSSIYCERQYTYKDVDDFCSVGELREARDDGN